MIRISNKLTTFVRPSDHSIFSPSAADAWMACAGRRNLIKDIPSETSKYSEEGTLAHSVCEAVFRKEMYDIEIPVDLNLAMAMLPDGGSEMLESAHGYYNVLAYWLNNKEQIGDVLWFGLERGIPVYPELGCFGTADGVVIGTKGTAIIDFKYGKGKDVAATSVQLKVYLAGTYLHLDAIKDDYQFHSVVFQPRTSPAPKHHTYTTKEIEDFAFDVKQAIERSLNSDELVEGNHCFWCPARRTNNIDMKCPIIKEKPLKLAQENFGAFLRDMNVPASRELNFEVKRKRDEAMLKIIAIAPLIAQVAEDAENELMERIQRGEAIEGVSIVDTYGNRKLKGESDKETAELIKQTYPQVEELFETKTITKLKTITQIEKTLGKGKLDTLCFRPIKKKLKVFDEKTRSLLGEMQIYQTMISENSDK